MTRRANDFYPTPVRLTEQLLKHVPIRGNVLEPCAGDGAIAHVLTKEKGIRQIITNDINKEYCWNLTQDATDPNVAMWQREWLWYPYNKPTWVITNPPFNQAAAILKNAFNCTGFGVAFLLRLSFLEPATQSDNRAAWLKAHEKNMSDLLIFGSPRPSFTSNGRHDSVTTAWMVWKKEHSGGTNIKFITDWK